MENVLTRSEFLAIAATMAAEIDAAAEESSERHVADHPQPDRFLELAGEAVDRGGIVAAAVGRDVFGRRIPVALDRDLALRPGHAMRRRQFGDPGEHAFRPGAVAQRQIGVDPGEIGLARHQWAFQQRLDLGGKDQAAVRSVVVDRLDPEPVARDQDAVAAHVVQRERKHAAQMIDTGVTVVLVQMHDDFGIGIGAEAMAARFELASADRENYRFHR